MTTNSSDGCVKNILIRPGQDQQPYEKLKAGLFSEWKLSRRSEEKIVNSIALAQCRRADPSFSETSRTVAIDSAILINIDHQR
jgi:hypothetical protein